MSMTPNRTVLSACAAALVLAWASLAHAQNPVAQALFDEGRKLMEKGKYEEACPKFEKSLELEHKLGAVVNAALCHEKMGRTATAWAEFKGAVTEAKAANDDKRRKFSADHVKALDALLSRVTIASPTTALPAGARITFGSVPVDAAALGTPLPFDPGTYELHVEAPGKVAWTGSVRVPPGPSLTPVEIPALEDVAAAPPPPPPPPPKVVPPPPPPPPPEKKSLSPLAIAGFSIGGAGLLVGAITGGVTLSMKGGVEDACPNKVCSSADQGKLNTALALANVSNAAFAVAGVGVILGIVGVALPTKPKQEVSVTPVITGTGAALFGTF